MSKHTGIPIFVKGLIIAVVCSHIVATLGRRYEILSDEVAIRICWSDVLSILAIFVYIMIFRIKYSIIDFFVVAFLSASPAFVPFLGLEPKDFDYDTAMSQYLNILAGAMMFCGSIWGLTWADRLKQDKIFGRVILMCIGSTIRFSIPCLFGILSLVKIELLASWLCWTLATVIGDSNWVLYPIGMSIAPLFYLEWKSIKANRAFAAAEAAGQVAAKPEQAPNPADPKSSAPPDK